MLRKRIFLVLTLAVLLLPFSAAADDVVVTAQVSSEVSPILTTVTTNLSQLPADGVSSVIITVTAKNTSGTIASGVNVIISSNRGDVDIFHYYDGNELKSGNAIRTDADGIARFTARSKAPGIATFSASVDTVIANNKPSVTFTPLPFLSNITITVKVPGGKKIHILQPQAPKVSPGDTLVNTQMELQISIWVFILLILILLSSPVLFTWLLIIYYRLRIAASKNEDNRKKEEDLLAKVYALEQQVAQNQMTEMAKIDKAEAEISEVREKTN
jgi:hypothetical protein